MGYIIALLAVVFTIAFAIFYVDSQYSPPGDEVFNTTCLDGVEYWYRQSGYKATMAVRYDAETLTPVVCE